MDAPARWSNIDCVCRPRQRLVVGRPIAALSAHVNAEDRYSDADEPASAAPHAAGRLARGRARGHCTGVLDREVRDPEAGHSRHRSRKDCGCACEQCAREIHRGAPVRGPQREEGPGVFLGRLVRGTDRPFIALAGSQGHRSHLFLSVQGQERGCAHDCRETRCREPARRQRSDFWP